MLPPELPPTPGLLVSQPWRGNIRELRNVLEQAVMRSDSQSIDAAQLARVLREAGVEPGPRRCMDHPAPDADDESPLPAPWPSRWPSWSAKAIAAALKAHGGKLAARQLGVSRATLAWNV